MNMFMSFVVFYFILGGLVPPLFLSWLFYSRYIRGADPKNTRIIWRTALAAGVLNALSFLIMLLTSNSPSNPGDSETDFIYELGFGFLFFLVCALLGAVIGKFWTERQRGQPPMRLARGTAAVFLSLLLAIGPLFSALWMHDQWKDWADQREYQHFYSQLLNEELAKAQFQEFRQKQTSSYAWSGLLRNPTLPENLQIKWAGKNRMIDLALLGRENLAESVARKIVSEGNPSVRPLARDRLEEIQGKAAAEKKERYRVPASANRLKLTQ